MKNNELKSLHKYCRNNLKSLRQSNRCGCFCCCTIFDSKEVESYTDNGVTAICPNCFVDSVISDNDYDITQEFLQEMEKYWFNQKILLNGNI